MSRQEHIASDIHLGAVPAATERAFLEFLEHAGTHASSLLIAGDLFDFWFEYGDVIHGPHYRVLAGLARLVEAGIPVTLAGGNHDFWGGRFLRDEVGVTFHSGPFRTELAGRPALVAHGDGLGRGDLRYRILKAVLRSRAAIGAFRALHPELGVRIARLVSSTKAKADTDPGLRARARFLEEWSRGQLAADASLAWVVCGHAHLPAIVEVESARYYLNAGDWITHFTYITIDGAGVPSLHRWRERRPADRT
jgi:UDP-2,3-diacylglucosamine hydrolase